jgi:hypothetical protein
MYAPRRFPSLWLPVRASPSSGGSAPQFKIFGLPDYHIGDPAPILYVPERPETIRIDTWVDRWFSVLVLGMVGVGFFATGDGTLGWSIPVSQRQDEA